MDEKFMSLTSRSCNTTRNQQNGNFKVLLKQESDLRTSRTLTKDISKNIFDTSPHIKASTGNNTPRGANSPEKKQRSSSLLSRNSLRNLFQYQGKEKSKQTFSSILDLIDPKVRRLRKKSQPEISKFDLKKARLGIETKGVLKSARLYSYNSPRVMKGDEQQNLMSFLTSKLTKYKSSLQNLEDCKLQEV